MAIVQAAPEIERIDLKDPGLAALLAWLIPGLGHFYQGRTAKGMLFFVAIMATFVYGLYLGGSPAVGWGRVVYIAWNAEEHRWHYFCQLGMGLPALPALIQASRASADKPTWWGGFMAPPRLTEEPGHHLDRPTESTLHLHLNRFFELGTVFTMVAGLLNILAIFDAWDGPVLPPAPAQEDAGEEKSSPVSKEK